MSRIARSSARLSALLLLGSVGGYADEAQTQPHTKWCDEMRAIVKEFKWKLDPCEAGVEWRVGGTSVEGRPLMYSEFGNSEAKNTTLVLAMVHPDEVTPLYLGLKMAQWLKNNQDTFGQIRVVVAPFINPDGFYRKPRTRTNARGVDVNRNFPTADWGPLAQKMWKEKFASNPRRFPGEKPSSEPETVFQEELIRRIKPQKILSVHSPLNHMDYDGPSDHPSSVSLARFPLDYVKECMRLRSRLKAVSTGFFPGSLGNYAGQEMGIPTVTLELPTADHARAEGYWFNFKRGIRAMIEYVVPNYAFQGNPRT
jgi:murein peptide amidase A